MMEILHLTVNNKPVEVAVDPRESLADTLRERLGLTSVKKGCEVGECGACTVLVDGEAIDSCIYLSVWADGKTILTVEGLQQHHLVPLPGGEEAALSGGEAAGQVGHLLGHLAGEDDDFWGGAPRLQLDLHVQMPQLLSAL